MVLVVAEVTDSVFVLLPWSVVVILLEAQTSQQVAIAYTTVTVLIVEYVGVSIIGSKVLFIIRDVLKTRVELARTEQIATICESGGGGAVVLLVLRTVTTEVLVKMLSTIALQKMFVG